MNETNKKSSKKVKNKFSFKNQKIKFIALCKYIFSKQFVLDKYLILALFITVEFNDILLRYLSFDTKLDFKPLISNIVIVSIMLLFTLIFPRKMQSKVIIFFIFTSSFLSMANFVYYGYFRNFLTLGQLSQTTQLGDVKESIVNLISYKMIFFFITPIILMIIYRRINKKIDMAPLHNRFTCFKFLIVTIVVTLMINISMLTTSDFSRITKMWNRELVVDTFGIYTYQFSDAIKVVSSKYFTNVQSKDEAIKEFNDFYTDEQLTQITNQYTGTLAGRNVYYIHYESAQNFVVDLSINGQEVTPVLNKLVHNSTYFSNFNAQESYGTSSDTEFTNSTSLMPLSDGTVFVTDADKSFITMEKILRDNNYGVYAFHGNKKEFWNRSNMLPALGYNEIFGLNELDHTQEDLLGPWGLDDGAFYKTSAQKLAEVKQENPDNPLYAQFITLTNHHPFEAGAEYSTLDLGGYEEVNEEMTRYLKSLNYADSQLQVFFDEMGRQGLLENSVVVLYGDHDARLPKEGYNSFVNYDFTNDVKIPKTSELYHNLDDGEIKDFKEVPMLIWTNDNVIQPRVISQTGGMIDVLPTVNNLLGIHDPYQLGFDLFNPRPKPVVFPNGSWKNDETYFDASSSTFYGVIPSEEVKAANRVYTSTIIELSRNTIFYDLQKDLIDFTYDDEIVPIEG